MLKRNKRYYIPCGGERMRNENYLLSIGTEQKFLDDINDSMKS